MLSELLNLAREGLEELRRTRKAIEGLRRDLKRRDARDQGGEPGKLVVLPHEPRKLRG